MINITKRVQKAFQAYGKSVSRKPLSSVELGPKSSEMEEGIPEELKLTTLLRSEPAGAGVPSIPAPVITKVGQMETTATAISKYEKEYQTATLDREKIRQAMNPVGT
jgi:hypothetical protein